MYCSKHYILIERIECFDSVQAIFIDIIMKIQKLQNYKKINLNRFKRILKSLFNSIFEKTSLSGCLAKWMKLIMTNMSKYKLFWMDGYKKHVHIESIDSYRLNYWKIMRNSFNIFQKNFERCLKIALFDFRHSAHWIA